jgi:hypothetical protein
MATTELKSANQMVQSMRQIRDDISNEIKNMSFDEERDFLDKLLTPGKSKSDKKVINNKVKS